jgi:hypothetical protein
MRSKYKVAEEIGENLCALDPGCTYGFHFALLAFFPALNGSDRITAKLYM